MKKTSFHKKGALSKLTALFLCILMIMSVVPSGLYALATTTSDSASAAASGPRLELNFNKNWKFHLGDVSGAQRTGFDDSSWATVDLPYDFSIIQDYSLNNTETESGFLPGGTGWYRKKFSMPSEYSDKSVLINFDQSYNNTYVYVNGKLVAENHYGYNSFSVDISSSLIYDGTTANVIAVKVVNEIPSSRWYSGSGIISDVTMTITDKVHVSLYGTQVTTPNLSSGNATTAAAVTLENDSDASKTVQVIASVLNNSGALVASSSESTVTLDAGASQNVDFSINITNPTLWSVDNPTLYTLRVVVKDGATVLDQYDTEFGYRYINWDATNGFSLNGQKMKLNGVSMHHDQGALGANQEYDAIYRQVSILKSMGCNAIRTSHNVCSSNLLKVCNELGMLVMEELFDGWFETKGENNTHDFSEYFNVPVGSTNKVEGKTSSTETWAEFVVRQTIKRDRNNPSIVIWSLGNELNPTSGTYSSYQTAARNMQSWIDELDYRPTTHGDNKQGNDSTVTMIDGITDVVGGNYFPSAWTNSSKRLNKPFVGTETVSAVGSRGIYSNVYSDSPSSPSEDASYSSTHYANTSTHQINAYDASFVNWGNTAADSLWYVLNNDWYSGQFVWTGFDYIGEPTPWWTNVGHQSSNPNAYPNSSYFGIIDTAGFGKDSYYLYRSIWNADDSKTTLHLVPGTWNSSNLYVDSNGYVNVVIYSNAPVVKLYSGNTLIGTSTGALQTSLDKHYYTYTNTANDTSVCKAGTSLTGTNDHNLYAKFQVKYASVDTLSVKAFEDDGTTEITDTVGTKSVKKNTSASQIAVSVWNNNTTMTADADSYSYVEITALDENGNFANDYNGTLNINLTGVGEIAGVDNGNAATTQKFQQKSALTSDTTATIQMFNGKALVLVKSTEETGNVTVTVDPQDTGFATKTVSLNSQAETGEELTDEFEEVVNQSNRVDTPESQLKYDELVQAVDNLQSPGETAKTYELYTPSSTTLSYLPSGEYIITGAATNSNSKGVLTHTAFSSGGLTADGTYYAPNNSSTTVPAASSDKWTFERQSNGTYYIYYLDSSNARQYLNISGTNDSGTLTTTTTPQALTLALNTSNGSITIGSGSGGYLNYYGGGGTNKVHVWSAGTALYLYKANGSSVYRWSATTPAILDGNYVIYNQGYAMTDTATSTTNWAGTAVAGIAREAATVSGNTLTPTDGTATELTFTYAGSSNTYYIQNAAGQYLNITSGTNNRLQFTSTQQALTVTTNSDGTILVGSGTTYIDHFAGETTPVFSTYNSNSASTDPNKKLTLYAPVGGTDPDKLALYNALKAAVEILPDNYTEASYNKFLDAIANGVEIYNDEASDSDAYAAATQAIQNAKDALVYTQEAKEQLKSDIDGISVETGLSDYVRYNAHSSSSTLPDTGEYIIYGVSATGTSGAWGVMTHNTVTDSGFTWTGTGLQPSSGAPTASSPTWHIDRATDVTSGTYYRIYYVDGTNVARYLRVKQGTINNNCYLELTTNSSDQTTLFTAAIQSDGSVIFTEKQGSTAITYLDTDTYNSSNISSGFPLYITSYGGGGTALRLYEVSNGGVIDWNSSIDNNAYIIASHYTSGSSNADVMSTNKNDGSYNVTRVSVTDNVLRTSSSYEIRFTHVLGEVNKYYAVTTDGKYLQIGSNNEGASGKNLTLVDTQNDASPLTVLYASNGDVYITNGASDATYLDYYSNNGIFSTWNPSSANSNNIFRLYSLQQRVDTDPLYEALKAGNAISGSDYTTKSYNELLHALEDGLEVYNNTTSSDSDERQAAADAIYEAIAALTFETATFASTLYKYGFDKSGTSATTKYLYSGDAANSGGAGMTQRMIAAMKAKILDSTELMNQINALTGVTDSNRDAVVTAYAQLYTLRFIGRAMSQTTGQMADINDAYGNARSSFWNNWWKPNTQGANDSQIEGASVQGIFSTYLDRNTNLPTSNDPYAEALKYINTAEDKGDGEAWSGATNLLTVDGVTLQPLNNISVYVGDLFSRNNLASTPYSSNTSRYDKYYWDLQFPFRQSTNEFGVNSYVYDSNSESYVFQAYFDDNAQTATASLNHSTSDWAVKKSNGDSSFGKGFFPFNHQLNADGTSTTDFTTKENAIYHFGMTFSTNFTIPKSGYYSDGSEIVFNFAGDDDVLVYIDDVLVLDNGGIHGARSSSINFTHESISYQYIADLSTNAVRNSTEGITLNYSDIDAYRDSGLTQNVAALEKLNQVATDGKMHKFTFYYLERGSNESNCVISFNIQPTSDDVIFTEQTLVADFGLPISYDVTKNNTISEAAKANGATVRYLGITDNVDSLIVFDKPTDLTSFPSSGIISRSGSFGDYTVTKDGVVTYDITTTEFSASDTFYLCAEVTGDPTYTGGTVYYYYEKVSFIPATTVYYEDDFREGLDGGISYTDGTVWSDFDNSTYNYGKWQTATLGEKAANQAADLVGDVNANVYGFDKAYENFDTFSNASAKKVTVSTRNNPNPKYSGGSGASWPEVKFTFKGTGFDLISVTDCTTGVFAVDVYEGTDTTSATGTCVRSHIVDTYYGYSYAKLYADAKGEPTSTDTGTPLYWTKNNTCTTTKNYYDENGVITTDVYYYDVSGSGYTKTPTYYDSNNNLTTDETDNPAYSYAYAYGWIKDDNSSTDSLYQIPVIRVTELEYKQYTVVITPMFSTFYGHYNEDSAGNKNYNLYVDGIRIYDPAGSSGNISDSTVADSYNIDGESNVDYIELRDMLLGAESFGADDSDPQKGVIFIDGIPALSNDLEKYKNAGPNNELYLGGGQAVAFEIWATEIPTDVQFSAKSAKKNENAVVSLSYNGKNTEKTISTATEMYYSFDSVLSSDNRLTWTQATVDGETYYTTGTIVLANSDEQSSILSIGNIKWTFSTTDGRGHYKVSPEPVTETFSLMSTRRTLDSAYTAVSAMYSDLSISDEDVRIENTSPVAGEDVVITVETSDDVKTLLIKDSDGNIVEPVSIEEVASELENEGTKQWKVTLNETEAGTYVYTVTGVNEYGLEGSDPVEFTVTVSPIPDAEEETKSFLDKLKGFFERIVEFFKKLLQIFK
ncbi:MAG: glycoside hydrolase family 2 TIM barrel-domain containing protein [Acutalibacteraceae bacterium]